MYEFTSIGKFDIDQTDNMYQVVAPADYIIGGDCKFLNHSIILDGRYVYVLGVKDDIVPANDQGMILGLLILEIEDSHG